jgi:hypothetical protein
MFFLNEHRVTGYCCCGTGCSVSVDTFFDNEATSCSNVEHVLSYLCTVNLCEYVSVYDKKCTVVRI